MIYYCVSCRYLYKAMKHCNCPDCGSSYTRNANQKETELYWEYRKKYGDYELSKNT